MAKVLVLAVVLLVLLQHSQYHAVQGQRTLVSLTNKLKRMGESNKKKAATASAPLPFKVQGKGYFWERDWDLNLESDDMLAICTTLLLVVFSAIMMRLRALGEYYW
jgi:hypothetical protein